MTLKRNVFYLISIFLIAVLFFPACNTTPTPKPRAYFRIALPDKEYQRFDSTYPYSFEYPKYAKIHPITGQNTEPYWMDIDFPSFKGAIHLSYKKVKNIQSLNEYFEDARSFANKHIPKATAIVEQPILEPSHNVYGLWYTIEGSQTASYHQFYLTDSLEHFLRGALYFKVNPNNDSLQPVIDFMGDDIARLIQSLQWK